MIKVKLDYLFLVCLLSSSLVSAKGQKEYFVVASSASGENTFIGNIYTNNDFSETELKATANNDNSFNTLEYYYTLGKKNNTDKIKQLSYSQDGSLTWMDNELKAVPDKFSGFKKLYKVEATKHLYWGGYEIYVVDWFTNKEKKVMSWYDAIYCTERSKCFISNLMINGSERSSIYAEAINLIYQRPLSTAIKLSYSINILPDENQIVTKSPLNLSFNIDWLREPYEISLKEVKEKNKKEKKLSRVSSFLLTLWKLNLGIDSPEAQKTEQAKAINENWIDFNPSKMFTIFNKNIESQQLEKSYYIPSAYIQKLTNMDSYYVLGYLYAENETYIIGNSINKNNVELLVFSINNADYKLKQTPENDELHTIIQSSIFHKKLASLIEGI
ncbi:hypothetical protein [Photobacterium sp. GB-210]|uniref:hypothetical protein n=1 Tax=Photobacterium sp. GB-210 TaxID=2022104 RepID=UPI000D15610B|nr:hypothetical protein [Photobacterium sp. GB-210]PSV33695.1 hypothetical protein C9J38_20100 [Photobacterium sp. GB-210]